MFKILGEGRLYPGYKVFVLNLPFNFSVSLKLLTYAYIRICICRDVHAYIRACMYTAGKEMEYNRKFFQESIHGRPP